MKPTTTEEFEQLLSKKLTQLSYVVAVGWALLAGAFALGVWVSTLEVRSSRHEQAIGDHGARLSELNVFKEVTVASRFTHAHAASMIEPVVSAINTNDKRITRVEDALTSLNATLRRIEDSQVSALQRIEKRLGSE